MLCACVKDFASTDRCDVVNNLVHRGCDRDHIEIAQHGVNHVQVCRLTFIPPVLTAFILRSSLFVGTTCFLVCFNTPA